MFNVGANFLLFNFWNHPNMFPASLMFESEIVTTVEGIGPKVMLVNCFIAEVLYSHQFITYWSNEVLLHSFPSFQSQYLFSPVFETFFAFDFIGIVVLLIWFMFTRTGIYVLEFCAFVVLDIFEQLVNQFSIIRTTKQIKFQ